jgi:hypothetical protein
MAINDVHAAAVDQTSMKPTRRDKGVADGTVIPRMHSVEAGIAVALAVLGIQMALLKFTFAFQYGRPPFALTEKRWITLLTVGWAVV